ncbi:MAG: CoA transferase [Phenylobacterium sp.]|uniref:CaiB/BaiF CoA transferase family protein n=1 Tax=Phenylobacterium sp. TaxID=1871053 RepID=UPI00273676E5|nr:CoA transferase [Phenylobacterium sp.]MDP3747678.1 CoA transferase [Phenylobacterium sp.]
MSAPPFANVRVLDFTHFLSGPFCTFQLAMQGADVLKVEPRGGEAARGSAVRSEWSERRMSPSWIAVNAGKRSLTLDLAKPEAIEIVNRLVRDADVVVENFRPGVMNRLGIGYEQLSRINPNLIYCAISGFGATGPESGTPSFDGKIQAMSGLMSLTGDPESGPMRAGFAAADVTAGLTSAFAISAALYQRTQTGTGQYIDVAMLDSLMNMFAGLIAEYTITGVLHRQFGNRSVSRLPTADRFRCGDGYIVLAVLTEKQFVSLMNVLGRADVLADPRFADWSTRLEHAAALREVIEAAMADAGPAAWEQRLTEAGVPCATVYTLEEIMAHPQVAHRGTLQTFETPHGPVELVGPGFRLAHGQGAIGARIASPGEHAAELLTRLGYDAAAIGDLRAREVI